MRRLTASVLPPLLLGLATLRCGGTTGVATPAPGPASPSDTNAVPADSDPGPPALANSDKIDVLFVVDDSSSMADKSGLLADSVGTLLRRLAKPNCVDASGKVVATSEGGACSAGALEFAPVPDIHVGVITSSLGSMGGDVCAKESDKGAHLQTSGVPAAAKGFLTYGRDGTTDVDQLVADTQALIRGVGEMGCGFEAQLEAAYRFLVQPDPWQSVVVDGNGEARLDGVDDELLRQRAAFLRPDSLVSVVMITDEDDSAVDPRGVGGQAWAFETSKFPGSTVFRADGATTTAPRSATACLSNPGAPACTSCGFALTCDAQQSDCAALRADPRCQTNGGYYGPSEDPLQIRFHRMKERYGVDPQFPIARYVDGFTKAKAPSRDAEHDAAGAYAPKAQCRNPLFAAALPASSQDELCNVPRGARPASFVFFTILGGVPEALVAGEPQWEAIVGRDPLAFDFTGIDPHMIPSATPRVGLPGPSATRGDNGSDPISGRDWDTGGQDLQFACTFALPKPRTCTADDPSCDCAGAQNPPLCGATPGEQIRGKAYPTMRELLVAKGLGGQAVVGSVCAVDAAQAYRPTMNKLVDRLAPSIRR